jgi:endonuclease/exonuclease/phosphatase family metal-dependent hydrolase
MLRLFTLNLRFGLAKDGGNSWPFRKSAYPTLVNRFPSDFFCFQEANDFQIDYLKGLLPNHGVIGRRMPAPAFWQSNVIFYHRKWECIHEEHFFLSPTPDIPSRHQKSRWPRQCTVGVFRNIGRVIICVNTHFDFESGVQQQSAELILCRIARLDNSLPTVILGDFNAGPSSECYKTFTQPSHGLFPLETGFKNAFLPPFPGTHHGFTGKHNGEHIDWILYRGGINRKNADIVTDLFNGIYPSDHFPLIAEFVVEDESGG